MNQPIYILLPVYNRCETTRKFLACLKKQTYKNFFLIVIDDGSIDKTVDFVYQDFPEATIIKGYGNWWWAGSLQQGFDWLKLKHIEPNSIILIANDDIEFDSNFLKTANDILSKRKGILVAQILNQKTGLSQESGVVVDFKKLTFSIAKSTETINCLPTRGMFIRFCDILKVGNFYPKILPHYLSDYEYTIRARRKGIDLMTSDQLLIRTSQNSTGYRDFNNISFCEFTKKYFSKKSSSNPFFWSTFIILASPKFFIPHNLIIVWFIAIKVITFRLVFSLVKIWK